MPTSTASRSKQFTVVVPSVMCPLRDCQIPETVRTRGGTFETTKIDATIQMRHTSAIFWAFTAPKLEVLECVRWERAAQRLINVFPTDPAVPYGGPHRRNIADCATRAAVPVRSRPQELGATGRLVRLLLRTLRTGIGVATHSFHDLTTVSSPCCRLT